MSTTSARDIINVCINIALTVVVCLIFGIIKEPRYTLEIIAVGAMIIYGCIHIAISTHMYWTKRIEDSVAM